MSDLVLVIDTPRWAVPLLMPGMRYYGARGGRTSGKSHFFAERLVDRAVAEPDLQWICIREIQRSLKYSAKKLIEAKIRKLRVSHLFEITHTEVRRRGGQGVIIFEGMQDHTADSIKSLEGFDGCWVEEAQSLSLRSIELLDPTLKKEGSELWFSWNPDQPEDAVEELFDNNPDAVLVHCTYKDNPWCPPNQRKLAERTAAKDYEKYEHVWLGGYNVKSEAIIFAGCYVVDEFVPADDWDGPYQGLDFGFAEDPLAAGRQWIHDNVLYIEHEAGDVGIELDHTAQHITSKIVDFAKYKTRADNARPDSISYLKRHGLPRVEPCVKGKGSIEDGIDHIKSYDKVVIHPRCENTIYEFGHYRFKVDRLSGEVLPIIIDKDNHWIDQCRYALEPVMKNKGYDLLKAMGD